MEATPLCAHLQRTTKSNYLLEYLHVYSCERENDIEIVIRLNIFLLQI